MTTCKAGIGPIHLVLGDAAGTTVRSALTHGGIGGRVLVVPDDLGHGPLDDRARRVAWMRACFEGGFTWKHDDLDPFAAWDELVAEARRQCDIDILVWAGDNVSERMLLTMACDRLADTSARVWRVVVPMSTSGHSHVGTKTPEVLAGLYSARDEVDVSERVRLAQCFVDIRDEGGLRRGLVDGELASIPLDSFDDLLLDAASDAWESAAQVVHRAMGAAPPREGLSDVFLNSRLQALIATDVLERNGPATTLREYGVRRRVA